MFADMPGLNLTGAGAPKISSDFSAEMSSHLFLLGSGWRSLHSGKAEQTENDRSYGDRATRPVRGCRRRE